MTTQPGKQTPAIHILPNISRSKSNQTKKFGQLIEYNVRKTFLEKSYKNVLEKLFPVPFLKNQYLWTNSLKLYTVCFYQGRIQLF